MNDILTGNDPDSYTQEIEARCSELEHKFQIQSEQLERYKILFDALVYHHAKRIGSYGADVRAVQLVAFDSHMRESIERMVAMIYGNIDTVFEDLVGTDEADKQLKKIMHVNYKIAMKNKTGLDV